VSGFSRGQGSSRFGVGVDAAAANLGLALAAYPGALVGGALSFRYCVNVSPANALRFTAFVDGGELGNCRFTAQLMTFDCAGARAARLYCARSPRRLERTHG